MPQFAPLQNDTFLRALLRQPTEYTPPESVSVLVEAVHEMSRSMRAGNFDLRKKAGNG